MSQFPNGVVRISNERGEQAAYGWSAEHDDRHVDGELARAALGYIDAALVGEIRSDVVDVLRGHARVPGWGWPPGWEFKPSDDPVENLAKAGALIAAEIDRLQRQR